MPRRRRIDALIKRKAGLLLDVSWGGTPQPTSVTLAPKGDIAQDPTSTKWLLPDGCVHTAIVTHVLEYVRPEQWRAWWDELHRVMRPHGIVYLSGPYGGDDSQGWLSDPTHRVRVVEQSFAWLDPRLPFYALHETLGRKAPQPWATMAMARVPGTHGTVSYNVTLQKATKA